MKEWERRGVKEKGRGDVMMMVMDRGKEMVWCGVMGSVGGCDMWCVVVCWCCVLCGSV